MQRSTKLAAMLGPFVALCALASLSPASASRRDDQIRELRVEIQRQADDVKHEDHLLRDLQRQRGDRLGHHEYRDAEALNNEIDSLRRHIDDDRHRIDRQNERLRLLQDRARFRDRYGDIDWRGR